jgi:hypothetical protein
LVLLALGDLVCLGLVVDHGTLGGLVVDLLILVDRLVLVGLVFLVEVDLCSLDDLEVGLCFVVDLLDHLDHLGHLDLLDLVLFMILVLVSEPYSEINWHSSSPWSLS